MTNGQMLRAKADEIGIPPRTREQVARAIGHATIPQDKAALARLMLRHGRLTPAARKLVERLAKVGRA